MEASSRPSHLRVALYGRVSTLDKGQDVNLQLNELREYSERRGWKIAEGPEVHVLRERRTRQKKNAQ